MTVNISACHLVFDPCIMCLQIYNLDCIWKGMLLPKQGAEMVTLTLDPAPMHVCLRISLQHCIPMTWNPVVFSVVSYNQEEFKEVQ